VNGEEIHSLPDLFFDDAEKILRVHLYQGFLFPHGLDGGLVEGHRADGDRSDLHDPAADLIEVAARTEVHQGVGPGRHGLPRFLTFPLRVGLVPGGPDVGVHLGAQAGADGQGPGILVPNVVEKHDLAGGDAGADELRVNLLFRRGSLHGLRDEPLAGAFQLGEHFRPPGR